MKAMGRHLIWGCAACMLLLVPACVAQTVTGSVTGEVTDPSGAVVVGAKVVATDINTGVATTATTNAAGVFRIEYLPIGRYQATVTAAGFRTTTIAPFSLEVQQTANFDVKLEVGSVSTNVNVSAVAPILNTTNPTIGNVFTATTIANIPLNGLDFSAVTLYMPGAVSSYGTSGPTSIERSTFNSDTPNFNGNRSQADNYSIDGIDDNETYNNLISYSPAPEAIEQMRVVTADASTDQGNVNGGSVEMVLKSGTNHFHGSLYGYVQNYRFDANSYLNGQTRNAQGQLAPTPISPFTQSQFGGGVGGPVFHNKLFFFADYLGARENTGGFQHASVITDAMRNGDFSALLTGSNPIQLYNSLSTTTVAGKTVYTFQPYSGDTGIPIISPVARFLFSNPNLYPDCGGANPTTPAGGQCVAPSDGIADNNYEAPTKSFVGNNQGDLKLEYDPGQNDKVTAFFSMGHAYNGGTAVMPILFPTENLYPTWLVGSNWVHTFSASLVNDARIGFTRTDWDQGLPTDPSGDFGIGGDAKVGITFPNQAYDGFTNQNLNNGLTSVGTPAYVAGVIDNTYTYTDILTWQRGKHSISMGVDAKRYQNNYPTGNNDGYLGSLNYSGAFTSNGSGSGGYGPADFVLDRVQSGGVTLASVNVGQRQWRVGGFAQDSYKVLPSLTLVYGLRYEYDEPWVEEQDRTGNINLATGQIEYAGHLPVGALPDAAICPNTACYQPNYRQWMPHLGFAYQIDPRAVVRGGFGAESFFEGNSFNQRLTAISPFLQAAGFSVSSPTPTSVATPNTAEEGFTNTDTSVQYSSSNNGYTAYPQDMEPAYVEEWNFTAEYALTNTASLQVGYVGELGQHIEDYGNVNQYRINNDSSSAPFYNSKYIGINGVDSALGVGGSGGLLITESRAMMNYNALQAVLRQHLSHGLEYTVNYTWGKAMTNSIGNYSLFGTFNGSNYGYSGAFQNYYNSHADYGPAGYDVKQDISATAVYAVPVGRGQLFLPNANRGMDEILGGWKFATAIAGYSGFPETIIGPGNNSNSYGSSRVNQYRPLKVVGRTNEHWWGTDPSARPCKTAYGPTDPNWGTCAFGVPATNMFGTESNGAVRGPGFFNTDLSAFKNFDISETRYVGFRLDAFNAFNIVSYGNPDTGISDSDFGNVSLQTPRSNSRVLQFSLHYDF